MKYYHNDHHKLWQWEDDARLVDDMLDADVVFLWNDFVYAETVRMLQSLNKKVIVFEHGYGALTEHESGKKPTLADGYMTFGEASRDSLIRAGVDSRKILVTGNPVFDKVPEKTKKTGKGLYVALHWVRDIAEYNNRAMTYISNCYPQYEWTIKLSDKTGYSQLHHDKWITKVENQESFEHIKEKIVDYDIVLTPKAGTFDMFAKLAGIPVYVIDEAKSYRQQGEPDAYTPGDSNYMELQEDIPEYKKQDLDYEVKVPSLTLDEILEWVTGLVR